MKLEALNKSQIIDLLYSNDKKIFEYARTLNSLHKGNYIHLRGLIEFSNICRRNCYYCGLRSDNSVVQRYRLDEDEILKAVEKSVKYGIKTVVLQSGEDKFNTTERLCRILTKIKKYDVAITLSIGELTYEEYKELKIAGADRYLLRIETTDEKLYNQLHPNMNHKNRFECLENLKSLGYETGTGSLVGLPNQTIESLADDILFFKELNADMVGIGPFIPHVNTPLANMSSDNFHMSLKVMALTRILLPDINIPATTAMESLHKNGQVIALQSGANVVMINVTDKQYKEKYEIYPNKYGTAENIEKLIEDLKIKIRNLGCEFSSSKGFRFDIN